MIGETLYIHDANRRVYTNEDGTRRDTPDPTKSWIAYKVIGETRDSWVLERDLMKVNKKTLELRGVYRPGFSHRAYTAEQMADEIWRAEHAHQVIRLVQHADIPTLRKIAELLGYGH